MFSVTSTLTLSYAGNARVPEELRFPHACCVGIASQTLLSVLNPTDRWLQVSIRVLSICVDGEKVSCLSVSLGVTGALQQST